MEKFFHQLDPIQCFMHMKAPRKNKKGDKFITATFRMPLDGNRVRSAPDFVQGAYNDVKDNGVYAAMLKQAIRELEIEIWEVPNPRGKKPSFVLESAEVSNLAVKEILSSKGDPSYVLTFEVLYDFDSRLWTLMGRCYGGDVFLVFDASNATLFEKEDAAADEEQGELLGEGKEEEEVAS